MNASTRRTPQRTKLIVTLALAACTAQLLGPGLVRAENPHFNAFNTTIQSDGDLAFTFKESGLGTGDVNYLFSADVAATCTCVTHKGNCPAAANKTTSDEQVDGAATLKTKNGRVSTTLTLAPPECGASSPPTCGNGQTLALSSVSYTNIQFKDATDDIPAPNLPSHLAATFFSCP
jgi:hypothetical protein